MSEKIYAWLLRFYPSAFNKAHGQEAIQLVRDRLRDENSPQARLKLWLELIADFVISLPREYRSEFAAAVVPQPQHPWDGAPSFRSLEDQAFSVGSLWYGGMASLLVFGLILLLMSHVGNPLANASPDTSRAARSFETKRSPTVALWYSPADPSPGVIVHLRAKVSALGGPAATGTVRFSDGSTILATGELDNGIVSVTAKLPTNETHSLSATYLGDSHYYPGASMVPKR